MKRFEKSEYNNLAQKQLFYITYTSLPPLVVMAFFCLLYLVFAQTLPKQVTFGYLDHDFADVQKYSLLKFQWL